MSHKQATTVPTLSSTAGVVDQDELEPMLFDLVRADKVAKVRQILPSLTDPRGLIVRRLRGVAASFGSAMMMKILAPDGAMSGRLGLIILISDAARAGNTETSKYLAEQFDQVENYNSWQRGYSNTLGEALKHALMQDSAEIWTIWERIFLKHQDSASGQQIALSAVSRPAIKGTARSELGETRLKSLWLRLMGTKSLSGNRISSALVNVGHTTCSVNLAAILIQHGANVNFQPQKQFPTALQAAAAQDTLQAATFMKFLLFQGADPTFNQFKSLKRRQKQSLVSIGEERGPQGISRWLGITWEELVAQARSERQGKGDGSEL